MVNEWRYSVSELSKSIAIERCDSRFAVICRRSCLADRPREICCSFKAAAPCSSAVGGGGAVAGASTVGDAAVVAVETATEVPLTELLRRWPNMRTDASECGCSGKADDDDALATPTQTGREQG